jgi:hypothetical protein
MNLHRSGEHETTALPPAWCKGDCLLITQCVRKMQKGSGNEAAVPCVHEPGPEVLQAGAVYSLQGVAAPQWSGHTQRRCQGCWLGCSDGHRGARCNRVKSRWGGGEDLTRETHVVFDKAGALLQRTTHGQLQGQSEAPDRTHTLIHSWRIPTTTHARRQDEGELLPIILSSARTRRVHGQIAFRRTGPAVRVRLQGGNEEEGGALVHGSPHDDPQVQGAQGGGSVSLHHYAPGSTQAGRKGVQAANHGGHGPPLAAWCRAPTCSKGGGGGGCSSDKRVRDNHC